MRSTFYAWVARVDAAHAIAPLRQLQPQVCRHLSFFLLFQSASFVLYKAHISYIGVGPCNPGTTMLSSALGAIALFFGLAFGQNCYYGPGAKYQASGVDLVPCQNSGNSACCIAGDTCLAGNACFNYDSGVTYQYGCTDITYKDESCPFKCGWSPGQHYLRSHSMSNSDQ